MYIGEIARLAGTSPKALRHYEALGFRLAELLPILAGDETDWAALSQHIAAKRAQIQQEFARLRQLDAQLAASTRKSATAWRASIFQRPLDSAPRGRL